MDSAKLTGFKEELLKEANKFQAAKKIVTDTGQKIVNKGKKAFGDAKEGYTDARENVTILGDRSKANVAGEFAGKNRDKILAGSAIGTTAAASYGGYRAIKGPEKKASLAKEAVNLMLNN